MRTPPAEILLAEFRQQQGHAAELESEESGHVLMDVNEQKPQSNTGTRFATPCQCIHWLNDPWIHACCRG